MRQRSIKKQKLDRGLDQLSLPNLNLTWRIEYSHTARLNRLRLPASHDVNLANDIPVSLQSPALLRPWFCHAVTENGNHGELGASIIQIRSQAR
jgi:hypothetical protein